ncbi:hypothetical protein JRQ81_014249 [Phrynocephalus forsythii]|uniref:DUF1279 domain-containing protein n=1 Tax=Phrynocephalus forsythii TaxID=171643 RepID=A0A9Q1B3B2_9SAUR|nr:hypothetical protein JRQ81_014249 [Phrynocephalus forsythii]
MPWLGQPCALHALSPGGLPGRSLAFGESLAGARALVGLLDGQVEPSPAGKEAAERARLPSRVRFCCPAVAGRACEPTRRERPSPLPRFLVLCKPPRWLHAEISLQATGSKIPTGGGSAGDGGRLGSRKDTSGSAANNRTDPGQEDDQKPNKSQQLKKVFKEYGGVAVAFHVGISLMSLGMFYLAVSSGVDMTGILFKLGFDEAVVQSKLAAGTSTFLLAYAIHKLFAPVRISITLISVPFLVRYFRKIGFFKPPAPNP